MKGKVLSVLPTLRDGPERDIEFVEVQIGLGKPTLAGVKKGTFHVGQEVDVPFQLLGRDGDSILMAMAEELYANGESDCEEVDCPELDHPRLHPLNYKLNNDDGGIKAGYLQKIWHSMWELGKFDVRPRFVYYFLDLPTTDGDLWDIVGLGYLISEYNWRVEHETAAEAEYRARENRLMGVRAAAKVRRAQGWDTEDVILDQASVILELEPELLNNNSRLADRILERIPELQDELQMYTDFGVSKQWVRKVIARLKRQGRL